MGATVRADTRVFKKAKHDFENRYKNTMAVLRRVRKSIGINPSVYWWYPAEVILSVMAHYQGGPYTDDNPFHTFLADY